jgi:hypothetical protein
MYETMEKKRQKLMESLAWCRACKFVVIPCLCIYLIYQVYVSYRDARARSKRGDALDFNWWEDEVLKSLAVVLPLTVATVALSISCGSARELAELVRESIPNGPTT